MSPSSFAVSAGGYGSKLAQAAQGACDSWTGFGNTCKLAKVQILGFAAFANAKLRAKDPACRRSAEALESRFAPTGPWTHASGSSTQESKRFPA